MKRPSTKAHWHSPNSSAPTRKGSDLPNSKYLSRTSTALADLGEHEIARSDSDIYAHLCILIIVFLLEKLKPRGPRHMRHELAYMQHMTRTGDRNYLHTQRMAKR